MRRGGKQLNTNHQSVTKVNPIRLDEVTSPRGKGEVLRTRLLAVKEQHSWSLSGDQYKPLAGTHLVVGDRMVGRCREKTWESCAVAVNRAAVRAAIVAWKRGNARGAKGGRKMDVA